VDDVINVAGHRLGTKGIGVRLSDCARSCRGGGHSCGVDEVKGRVPEVLCLAQAGRPECRRSPGGREQGH